MIAGTPVITTAHRSIPELIQDGFNGLLVPPLDSTGLAQAIHLLDSNRLLLADMGKNNWEMRINYSATDVIPDILRIMGIDI
jgi:glycosyltransferase involved in cell wall biosynthesis